MLKTSSLTLFLLTFLTLPVAAEEVTRRVDLDGVSRIRMDGSNNLHFTQGDDEHVSITTEKEMLERVDARVEGNMLHLSRKRQQKGWGWFNNDWGNNQTPVYFEVELKDLSQFRINGAGKVVMDELETPKLTLNAAGSSDFELATLKAGELRLRMAGSSRLEAKAITAKEIEVQIFGSGKLEIPEVIADGVELAIAGSGDIEVDRLETKDLEISINGSGDVTLAGSVDSQRLAVNGSGKYRAYGLASRAADIEVNGSGSVEVNVREQLTTELSRGSVVTYQGGPDLNIDASGGGRVRRAD